MSINIPMQTLPVPYISQLIQNQFPDFYRDEGENFIAFVRAYYEWLEQKNNILYHSRMLQSYSDIDSTPEAFISHFKNTYLQGVTFNTKTNKRLLIKKVLDLYRSKGSEQGLKLFFQLVFGENIDVYYPKDDIFASSNAEWILPQYLEISHIPNINQFLGKQIHGQDSNASAFVDRIVTRRIHGKYVNIFFITNISGTFSTNERITYENLSLSESPFVIGSISNLSIVNGGEGFSIGEIVNIVSQNGAYGQGIIKSISAVTGVVDFEFISGGFGYTNTANVNISEKIVNVSNLQFNGSSLSSEFLAYETVTQPLATISLSSIVGGSFAANDIVENYYPNNAVSANATVITANSTSITVVPNFNTLNYDSSIAKKGNTVTATISVYDDDTSTGKVIGFADSKTVTVSGNTFVVNERLNGIDGSNGVITAISLNNANSVLRVNSSNGVFKSGDSVTGETSGAHGVVLSSGVKMGLIGITGSFVSTPGNKVIGTVSNTVGQIDSLSTGTGASFSITGVSDVETITYNTDRPDGHNTGLIDWVNVKLDGSNSNVASNGYGFTKKPSANINSIVAEALSFSSSDVGVITGITGKNPGSGYNDNLIIDIIEPSTVGLGLHDYVIGIANASGGFTTGERVQQNVQVNGAIIIVTSGASTYQINEPIYQGTPNTATGIVQSVNALALVVNSVNGAFTTSANIHGVFSGVNTHPSVVVTAPFFRVAKGVVKGSNSSTLTIGRRSITQSFATGNTPITGISSGSSANVISVVSDNGSRVTGDNALVTGTVTSAQGSVKTMGVYSSGFGHSMNEVAQFISLDGERAGTLILETETQGIAPGFFRTIGGATSSFKYLEDNDFYQIFSYQIISSLNFEAYADMVKKVMHVGGTKMFGKTEKVFNVNVTFTEASLTLQRYQGETVIPTSNGNLSYLYWWI